jgi:signal transduction histidine kinase
MNPFSELIKINKYSSQTRTVKEILDKVLPLIRSAFIFDNFVFYRLNPEGKTLDVRYAKSLGRGKSAEADVSWGEILATKILEKQTLVLQKPSSIIKGERLMEPFLLGIPVLAGKELLGICVFIRYGGPVYTKEEIEFCQYFTNELGLWSIKEDYYLLQKEMNERLQATQLQEDFMNAITHEIRSPLGFIKGYATTLLRSDTAWNPETQKEFLEIIDHETDQLEELIDNLLDSARLQSGPFKMSFQPIRIEALINDVVQRNKVNLPELEFHIKFASKIPTIEGDPRRLAQVFENLINNAIKYAPHALIDIQVVQIKKGIRVSLTDHGPGIPEKYLPKIFERFFRNPEQSVSIHGSGLGLYICRQIIESHHGNIQVSSKVGEGTSFIIILPCTSGEKSKLGNRRMV